MRTQSTQSIALRKLPLICNARAPSLRRLSPLRIWWLFRLFVCVVVDRPNADDSVGLTLAGVELFGNVKTLQAPLTRWFNTKARHRTGAEPRVYVVTNALDLDTSRAPHQRTSTPFVWPRAGA